jgi:hypothetical protein
MVAKLKDFRLINSNQVISLYGNILTYIGIENFS